MLHFLFSAESAAYITLGRSPGFEKQIAPRLAPPSPTANRSSGSWKRRPHLQWRDRAGIAPDFPVTPFAGTNGLLNYSQIRIAIAISDAKIPVAKFKWAARGKSPAAPAG